MTDHYSKNIRAVKPHTDEEYNEAVRLVKSGIKPTMDALRSNMSIGSSKATRILDKMESRGFISTIKGRRKYLGGINV